MQDRFRLVGNAFHAGVLKHLMLCYVAHLVKRWSEDRDSVKQKGSIFMENQDGPRALWNKIPGGLESHNPGMRRPEWGLIRGGTAGTGPLNPNPNPSPRRGAEGQSNWGAIPGGQRPQARVKCELERPEGFRQKQQAPEPEEKKTKAMAEATNSTKRRREEEEAAKKGGDSTQAKEKKGPAWKNLLPHEGGGELQQPPKSMWGLMESRWRDQGEPGLEVLAWERQRPEEKKPPPQDAACLALFGRQLADDFAMKSKASAT